MERLLVFAFIFILSLSTYSQTKTIRGTVLDENSFPLSGATILEKGVKSGVQTDANGKFSIKISAKTKSNLIVSFSGYVSSIIEVGNNNDITIKLTKQNVDLDDVVVIGYNSIRRKDLTGSVSSLSAKQIKDIPLSSAAEAIQGRLAGVQATVSEGAPGSDVVIRVRGGGSITQDNSPLYIVDGVQVENALSVIAPQDIATIDVLKDASTTSIYGSRAANGVIIITTKTGRPGKVQVSFNPSYGFRHLPKFQEVMSPYDFVLWQYERTGGDSTSLVSFRNTYGTTWDTLSVYKNTKSVNWQDLVFGRNAVFQNHNLNLNGGNSTTTFNLSFTSNKEEGLQLESGFNRSILNFKLEQKISDKVKAGFTFRYLDQTIKGIGTTNSGTRTTNRLRHTITYRPFVLNAPNGDIDDFDEAYFLASSGLTNPVLLTSAEYRRQFTNANYFTGYLNYNLTKNLTFRSTFGYDNSSGESNTFFSKITSTARNSASLPVASISNSLNTSLNNTNTLQYSLKNFKKKHDFTFLLGQETVEQNSKTATTETRFFPADITPEKALSNMGLGSAPNGSQQPLPSSFVQPPSRIFSLFGRLSYAFEDKYLLNFNLRSDRSSKFNEENGSLVFPSGSFAWRFSKEKMFEKISWLNDAKVRLGYGSVGNNRIGNLLFQQLYGVTGQYALNHSIVPGFAPSSLANPNLRWEKNITRNIGLDLAFLNNRLEINLDMYKNTSSDLLLAVAIPPTSGYTSQIQNVGATTNKGIEIQLNAVPISNKVFNWTTNFNISFNKNTVDNLGGLDQIERSSGWLGSDGVPDFLVAVGKPVGQMYGFVTDGFFDVYDFNYNPTTKTYTVKPNIAYNSLYGIPQPGSLKWKDLDGDGQITLEKDRTIIGDANPKFIGGWNNQFRYKSFDLSVFLNFVYGNDVYNANKIEWTTTPQPNLNMLNLMKDRYTRVDNQGNFITDPIELTKLNENAKLWSPVRAERFWLHSWGVEDGSYIRVNNISLGYSIPQKILNLVKVSSLRFFATVNNLATLTKYTGYDPDVTTRRSDPLTPGVDFAAYPRSRTWICGLNVTF